MKNPEHCMLSDSYQGISDAISKLMKTIFLTGISSEKYCLSTSTKVKNNIFIEIQT